MTWREDRVFIGLGSNLGDREANIKRALTIIALYADLKKVSSLYETDPVGYLDQPAFLNAVAEVRTEFFPEEFLKALLATEELMGRKRTISGGPRNIDLDLLLVDTWILDTNTLQVPHPELANRSFVLDPLAEIAPEFMHPTKGVTIAKLAERLK